MTGNIFRDTVCAQESVSGSNIKHRYSSEGLPSSFRNVKISYACSAKVITQEILHFALSRLRWQVPNEDVHDGVRDLKASEEEPRALLQ